MSKSLSLHIGLNQVDPAAYNGWSGALQGCINDANSMRAIAEEQGYTPRTLIDSQATSAAVIRELADAARALNAGDYLLVTYSGHGGQVPDVNGDEPDGQDETWVLYDRMFVDDELYQMLSQFRSGVRILVLSDSCHSGSVVRARVYQALAQTMSRALPGGTTAEASQTFRSIPDSVARAAYDAHAEMYDTAQRVAGPAERAAVAASVILISGCLDNQLSSDGTTNGLFTEKLLQVWDDGAFTRSHRAMWQSIGQLMPPTQTPNFFTVGAADRAFEDQRPFTPAGGAQPTGTTSRPSVSAAASANRNGAPPVFDVRTGANRYYIFEITSNPDLFDYGAHGAERNADNFYATWSDSSVPPRLTAPTFTLPQNAWQRLRAASALYFRIGTTSSTTGWDQYTTSTGDRDGASAPSIAIVADSVAAAPGAPSVTGPSTLSRSDPAPSFRVVTGANPYYIFEITSNPSLFDGSLAGQRTPDNFYATWADSSAQRRYTGGTYNLPAAAWNRLKSGSRLYFRIGTSANATGWDNYMVSTLDLNGSSAPSIAITAARTDAGAPPATDAQNAPPPPSRAVSIIV